MATQLQYVYTLEYKAPEGMLPNAGVPVFGTRQAVINSLKRLWGDEYKTLEIDDKGWYVEWSKPGEGDQMSRWVAVATRHEVNVKMISLALPAEDEKAKAA